MDRLWAPWRVNYLKSKKPKGCVFCNALKGKSDYIFLKTRHAFGILNIYPYNNGHVMVSPLRHIADISLLKDAELLGLFRTVEKVKKMLDKALRPEGYNIGINTSKSAGAGEAGHLHIHIVPRWRGDANFITTVFDTKVIGQSLDHLYKELKKHA
ncbi:MAG: HIT domain-containing protein [Candidatus Omnitrophica bacterium]|nr:HIT domain-containing protein [Candidatus Omnitrophota bacterium]MDD5552762.1 HIT domain-containing protein [Candidatus Omnitrophota bacterium]